MTRAHVDHSDIASFAQVRVNLPKRNADEYRAQVRRLRDKLEKYLGDHPDFQLRKMLLSGSLAKGTALRSLNDIDVACYVSGADAPRDVAALLDYLIERLRSAFPNFKPDQIEPQTYSVKVSFRGSGLDVDVVPILYDNDPDWYGELVSQVDGSLLKTCIPRHLEFIRKRKAAHERDFAQVVRLIKFWVRNQKAENELFKLKSFIVELVLAHLAAKGMSFKDYPEALQSFFTYVAVTRLTEVIVFDDYYQASRVPRFSDPVQVIDPVNPDNNAGSLSTSAQVETIVEAALDAGDAIDSALRAPTKRETVYYWQRVFGPTFGA